MLFEIFLQKGLIRMSCDEIIQEMSKDREQKEFNKLNSLEHIARVKYALYFAWCKAFNKNEKEIETFKEYLKSENINLNFWVKKKISEMYFDCKYEFDYKKNKYVRQY